MALDVQGIRKQYKHDGFVTGLPVLGADETAGVLARLEQIEAEQAALHGGAWVDRDTQPWDSDPHPQEALLDPLVRDPRVLAPVQALLGPDVLLRNCDVFIKTVGKPYRIRWHTDTGRIVRSTNGMLTLWLALTPATEENGALEFVAGSHIYPEDPEPRDKKHLSLSEEDVEKLDLSRTHINLLEPGQASMHHFGLVHRSSANESEARRVALVMRFLAPWVSPWAAECGRATQVSGQDKYGRFRLEERFPVHWTMK